MQVDDALLDAVRTGVDPRGLVVALPCQAVQAQQVAVLGLDDVLLGHVAVEGAELDKVARIPYGG